MGMPSMPTVHMAGKPLLAWYATAGGRLMELESGKFRSGTPPMTWFTSRPGLMLPCRPNELLGESVAACWGLKGDCAPRPTGDPCWPPIPI